MKQIIFFASIALLAVNFAKAQTPAVVSNNNKMAFTLFKANYDELGNTLLSPFSINIAMAMTYEGAKGSTAKEFIKVLGFDKNKKLHHDAWVSLIKAYAGRDSSELEIANALMAQQEYQFRIEFFKSLEEYGALVQYANFKNETDRDAARRNLNYWISERTHQKINDLIKKDTFDELTRLVVVNAIYFRAKWSIAFEPKKTRQMMFYSPGNQLVCHFMHGREYYNFYEDSIIQAVELPYSGNRFSMVVILPKSGINIRSLSTIFGVDQYNEVMGKLKKQHVDVLLPMFAVSDESSLKKVFQDLGMVNAFSGKANFKLITGHTDLLIDDILHKTYIKIDESGTEAAGSTAVIIREKSAPSDKPVFFNANRPFFYLIKDNNSGAILFIGSINKPEKNGK